MLVTPLGLLFEFISGSRKGLDVGLFDILLSGSVREMMDYMLTPREQEVLYYAYFRGYYSQPHSVTLDRLAEELPVKGVEYARRYDWNKMVEDYVRLFHDVYNNQ